MQSLLAVFVLLSAAVRGAFLGALARASGGVAAAAAASAGGQAPAGRAPHPARVLIILSARDWTHRPSHPHPRLRRPPPLPPPCRISRCFPGTRGPAARLAPTTARCPPPRRRLRAPPPVCCCRRAPTSCGPSRTAGAMSRRGAENGDVLPAASPGFADATAALAFPFSLAASPSLSPFLSSVRQLVCAEG